MNDKEYVESLSSLSNKDFVNELDKCIDWVDEYYRVCHNPVIEEAKKRIEAIKW